MNLYFDTEFTGLVPNTTLISLGIVSEFGERFYAEFTDYDKSLVTPWIQKNIIDKLICEIIKHNPSPSSGLHIDGITYVNGSTSFIRKEFLGWLNELFEKHSLSNIQFVSDVCHYDFYLLQNQVFGGAFEMPGCINSCCFDICQMFCAQAHMGVGLNWNLTHNMKDAFNFNREEYLKVNNIEIPDGIKHDSLYDAEVIKLIYEDLYRKVFPDYWRTRGCIKNELIRCDEWYMKEMTCQ